MANTMNDLYLKYVNKVGKTLEKDRYFQYLFEMVQAGSTTLQQTHQVLHKVVDERWLSTIEESLDAINEIIEKPRRFIATSEEVVPVALAKKISADSVRHLSMNTQFIASSDNGEIQPTKILNVTTEESYDLYENRFIYHLIQRLVTFIDKRTDIIFWSTGDETCNTLKMKSKVDDAYEEIEYNIEMKIKNRQSFAENDSDNMQVFMRIDRVRRLVMALRQSSFCSLMAGCAKVRSPIQRTNLMMKDPNYRTCYKLWQFLESYDEVGYTIDAKDSSLEFDEEYQIQMFTNLITNYTVFKSILDQDPRKLEEAPVKKRSVIKPKFIKKIEEQIVNDYNIPDVEVRQVIIEEVTQAQLEAEAKLEEETALRIAAEEARAIAEDEMESAQLQLQNERWQVDARIMAIQQEAEEQLEEARQQADARIELVQNEANQQIEKINQEAEEKVEAAQREAEERIEKIRLEAETQAAESKEKLEETRREAEEQVQEAHQKAEILIAEERQNAQEKIAKIHREAENQIQEAKEQAESARKAAEEKVEATQRETKEYIQKIRLEAEAQIAESRNKLEATKREAETLVEETREQVKTQIELMQNEANQQIEKSNQEAEERIQEVRMSAEDEMAQLRRQMEEAIAKANQEAEAARKAAEAMKAEKEEALAQLKKEIAAREKAEKKADENRLTNRLIAALTERREQKDHKK